MSQSERRLLSETQLLSAACQVALKEGLQRLTCEEVGRLAGYSRAQAYQRFGSREGLLVAAVRHLRLHRRKFWEARTTDNPTGLDALIEHVSVHLEGISLNLEMAAFFQVVLHHPQDLQALRSEVAIARSELLDELKALITSGLRDGSIDAQRNSEEDSVLLLGLMLGIATEFLVARRDDELRCLRTRGEEMIRLSFSSADGHLPMIRH